MATTLGPGPPHPPFPASLSHSGSLQEPHEGEGLLTPNDSAMDPTFEGDVESFADWHTSRDVPKDVALGPDGFHGGFCMEFRVVSGMEVSVTVQHFFLSIHLPNILVYASLPSFPKLKVGHANPC